jgi:hypothetical protein
VLLPRHIFFSKEEGYNMDRSTGFSVLFHKNTVFGSYWAYKKVNVYLPSLMMKVPDHLYV